MNRRLKMLTAMAAGVFCVTIVNVTAQSTAGTQTVIENGLVGIKLLDPGLKVLNMYGTPNEIYGIGAGGGAVGPVGGGGLGAPSAAGGGRAGGGGGAGATAGTTMSNRPADPFAFGNDMLRLQGPSIVPEGMEQGPPSGGTRGGPMSGPGGAGSIGGGSGGAMAGTNAGGRIIFTRWVYNRSGSKYAFIVNNDNNVVQIEAVGISDAKVKTARGLGFGANFATIVKKYGAPDGYEISGDTIVVKYLQRAKVAFRLSRLGKDKPHVVTGVVVAGGKG